VYAGITGRESFEPWLSPIEGFPENSLWPLVEQVPPAWYGSPQNELERLLTTLSGLNRRTMETNLFHRLVRACLTTNTVIYKELIAVPDQA